MNQPNLQPEQQYPVKFWWVMVEFALFRIFWFAWKFPSLYEISEFQFLLNFYKFSSLQKYEYKIPRVNLAAWASRPRKKSYLAASTFTPATPVVSTPALSKTIFSSVCAVPGHVPRFLTFETVLRKKRKKGNTIKLVHVV